MDFDDSHSVHPPLADATPDGLPSPTFVSAATGEPVAGAPVPPAPAPTGSGCGCLTALGGVAVVLIGIPMLICPGPGFVVISAGIGMIATGLGLNSKKPPNGRNGQSS